MSNATFYFHFEIISTPEAVINTCKSAFEMHNIRSLSNKCAYSLLKSESAQYLLNVLNSVPKLAYSLLKGDITPILEEL